MRKEVHHTEYIVYGSSAALEDGDRQLLEAARAAASDAYAPYSGFRVGAAVQLANGETVTGSNQENMSFPAGLCAEGTALAAASAQFPGVSLQAIAVSYRSEKNPSDVPVTPCGICRQTLQEYSIRYGGKIKVIMAGMEGEVILVEDASALLPLAFKF